MDFAKKSNNSVADLDCREEVIVYPRDIYRVSGNGIRDNMRGSAETYDHDRKPKTVECYNGKGKMPPAGHFRDKMLGLRELTISMKTKKLITNLQIADEYRAADRPGGLRCFYNFPKNGRMGKIPE